MEEKIFKPGDKLDAQWTIRKIIDSGGMATVYLIVSPNDVLLAAKTFKHRFFNSPPVTDLFIQEAQNWINLPAHPNVVEARYVRKIEGKPYIFLDFVSGCTLREILWQGYSFETGLNYAIQICQGMAHVHNAGLIHRDLKPENILVHEFYPYEIKITDLGIAKVKQRLNELTHPPVTGPSAGEKVSDFHGTPLYMAPELVSKIDSFASDIYSFGVLLFEMLTRQHPFPQISELFHYFNNLPQGDPEGRIVPIFVGQLPDPQELNPIIPDELKELICRCINIDPNLRHEEALDCFDQCLKFNPQHVNSWSSKGNVLTKLQRYDEAERCLEMALQINPRDPNSINNMLVLYSTQKKFREALDWSDQLMEINPDYPSLAFNRASILFELNRIEEAYLLLKDSRFPEKLRPAALLLKLECLAIKTDLHPAPENYSAFTQAVEEFQALYPEKNIREGLVDILRMNPFDMYLEIARKEGGHSPNRLKAIEKDIEGQKLLNYYADWEGAKSLFLEAIALDPTFFDPHTNLGVALEKTGHIDAAIQSYNNAIAIQPDNFMTLFNKGNCYRKLKNYLEALNCYNDSMKQNNSFFQTWVFKGICHLELGQQEEAETSLLKALDLNPGYPYAIDLLRVLRQTRF